jgi:predicted  nucleic acid-binding Zn-ribbon protein
MTPEEKKLNSKYYKLLSEFHKVNKRVVELKKEMQEIRTKITPCEILIDNRPDEIILKHG